MDLHMLTQLRRLNVDNVKNTARCDPCGINIKADDITRWNHCRIFHKLSKLGKRQICDVCGKIITGKYPMRCHYRKEHKGYSGHMCKCGIVFPSKDALKEHKKCHMVKCDTCGITTNRDKLRKHIRNVHETREGSFKCSSCDRSYKSKTALQNHIKVIHEQSKELYPCDRCGKRLLDSYALKVHMLTHSRRKPFQCSEAGCDIAYTTKQCLQIHYKKSHGYTDNNMPNITRSVPFTFEDHTDTQTTTCQTSPGVCRSRLKITRIHRQQHAKHHQECAVHV